MESKQRGRLASWTGRPDLLRYVAIALCAACVLGYAAIGAGLIYPQTADGVSLPRFGFSTAAAFGLGVALLAVRPGRVVWTLGAAFMVFVIVAYVLVAPERQPPFEAYGIALKLAQAAILAALLGLLANDRSART